jgi:hypothetical protein
MDKVIIFLCLSFVAALSARGQASVTRGHQRTRSLQEADSASRSDGRPLFVYLYLDPCPACRSFESGTLSDPQVRKRLSEGFHFTALDVRTRGMLGWRGRLFGWDRTKGVNGVVPVLSKGALSFPVSVILSSDGSWHQAIPGDIGAEEMDCLLAFASEGGWKRQSYDAFRAERLRFRGGDRQ